MAALFNTDASSTQNLFGGAAADAGMGLPNVGLPTNLKPIPASNVAAQASSLPRTDALLAQLSAQRQPEPERATVLYNPEKRTVLSGAGEFGLSNLSEADAAIRSGAMTRNVGLNVSRPGYLPIDPAQLRGWVDQRAAERGFGSSVKEVGRNLVTGAVGGIPEMTGKAVQFFTPDDSFGQTAGQSMRDFGTDMTKRMGGAPDVYGRGEVSSALIEGANNLAPSALGMAAALANPAVGIAGIVTLFGGSQANDTYQSGLKQGLDKKTAMEAALLTGGIEGAGEAIADVIGGKLLLGGGKLVRSLTSAGKMTAQEAQALLTNPKMLGDFAKSVAGAYATEIPTEMAQSYGEAAVEKSYGVRPDVGPMAEAIHGGKVAAGMTTLMAPLGLRSHARAASQRAALGHALNNYDTPTDMLQAAEILKPEVAKLTSEEEAAQWLGGYQSMHDSRIEGQVQDQMAAQLPPPMIPTPAQPYGGIAIGKGGKYGPQIPLGGQPVPTSDEWRGVKPIQNEEVYTPPVVPATELGAGVGEYTLTGIDAYGIRTPAAPKAKAAEVGGMPASDVLPGGFGIGNVDVGREPYGVAPSAGGVVGKPISQKDLQIAQETEPTVKLPSAEERLLQQAQQGAKNGNVQTQAVRESGNQENGGQGPQARGENGIAQGAPQGSQGVQVRGAGQEVKLTAKQRPVYEYMLQAVKENREDDIVDADGVLQYQKIADALGMARGSAKSFVDGAAKAIAASQGVSVDQMKQALKELTVQRRTTQMHSADSLGLSPADQVQTIDEAQLFGTESGAEPTMGVINSVGGSQSDVGKDEIAPDYVDSVDPSENAKLAAAQSRNALMSVLGHPEAETAGEDWDYFKSDTAPDWSALSVGEQAEWVSFYVEHKTDEQALKSYQRDMERFIEPDGVKNETERLVEDRTGAEQGGAAESRPGPDAARGAPSEVRTEQPAQDELRQAPAPKVTTKKKRVAKPAQVDVGGSVWPADFYAMVEQTWNRDIAGPAAIAPFDRLADGQKYKLLDAVKNGNDEAQGKAVKKIIDELSDVEGEPKFSEGEGSGSKATEVAASLKQAFLTPSRFNSFVTVVQSVDALPAKAKGALSQAKDPSKVQGLTLDGRVYLVADSIPRGQEMAVFLHEVGVHLGMEKLIGADNMADLVGQVRTWGERSDNSLETRLAKAALERAGASSSRSDEETLAYFVEEAVNAGVNPTAAPQSTALGRWFRQFWAAAKLALRKIGLGRFDKLSSQDIVNLAFGAAHMEIDGTWHGTAAQFRKFDHRKMGSGEGAQAFGWGSYTAQRVGVAKGYHKADVKRKDNYSYEQAQENARQLRSELDRLEERSRMGESVKLVIEGKKKALADAVAYAGGLKKPEGALLRTVTDAHEDELLDWDKPLSEQSETVKNAIENAVIENKNGQDVRDDISDASSKEVYEFFSMVKGSDKAASEYLNSLGIKGIKFLDQVSRNARVASYKVFPDGSLGKGYVTVHYYDSQGDRVWNHRFETSFRNESDAIKYADSVVSTAGGQQTRNIVTFDDKNVHRIISEIGADRNRIKFSESAITKVTDKLPEGVRESSFVLATNLSDLLKKGLRGIAFGHDLADMITKNLPSAKHYFDLSGQRGAELVRHEAKVDDILNQAYDAKDVDALNAFINKSTREQKWGFKLKEDATVALDPELERMYKALSPEAQKAARAVFVHGHETITSLNNLVREELETGYDTTDMTEKEKAKVERQKLRALHLFDKTFKALSGPYAPLVRIGNYVTAAKSQAYLDAVESGDEKRVEQLQSDPEHYYVEFHETLGEAQAQARKLASLGKYATGDNAPQGFAKEHFYNKGSETPWGALKRVRQMIDADADDTSTESRKAARAMRNMLNDLYFATLAEGSARQFQNKRRNISGETKDMLRAFAIKGRADAHFMTSLKYGGQLLESIQAMRSEALKGANRADRVRDLNEVLQRHALSMDYRHNPALSKVQGLTSFWMLVTNPAYYLQNATQPFMMSMPWMAGKYGFSKASGALFKAYKDLSKGKLDIDKMPITADEKEALKTLRDRGVVDIGINHDLGYWASTDNKGVNAVAKVQHFFARQIQRMETINRISTALAAYRLSGGDVEYAAETIRVTHGDYSQFNAPRLFSQMPAGQVLLQFRKFQIIQLSLLARLIKGGFTEDPSLSKEDQATAKAIARKTLALMLGNYAVVAGGLGLPAMSLIGMAITAALGEPGDPDDEEYLLRRAIGNKELSDLLLRGVPAYLGVNMSQRLGAQNITSLTPFASKDITSKDGFQERVVALLGPWAGLGSKVADGIGLTLKGDVYKGMEQMLPSGIAQALRAYRITTEGVTQRNRDVVLSPEEIKFADTLFQALGLPTTKLTDRQRNSAVLYDMQNAFQSTASELKNDYAAAARNGSDRARIVEKWQALQDAQRRNGFQPSPVSELFRAPSAQQRRESRTIGGLEYNRRSEEAARQLNEI